MRFYTTAILSANQELTPEGFLLCRNVPIARTGTQLYAAGELPLAAVDGLIRVERLPEDVFHPSTMASFEAKAVTLDHPAQDVAPSNWSELAKGIVQNVRRGVTIEDDLLLADFLIMDAEAIRKIRDKELKEVSCGYDAEYEQIEPGRGRQYQIIGNHVALVEKGRCGTRCAIGDSAHMKNKTKWMDRVRAAFKVRDESELEEALKEGTADSKDETEEEKKEREAKEADEKKTSDSFTKALDALSERLEKLESAKDAKAKDGESESAEEKEKREKEEKEKEGKSGDKARDSAALVSESQDVFARVEILSPGMALPTVDSADPVKFRDGLCQLKRKALSNAYENPKTRDAVTPLVAGVDLSKLTCDALHSTFVGASEIVRRENNAQTKVTFDSGKSAQGIATQISDMNRRNAQFWARN